MNTMTVISVDLDLPEFQWNQLEPRVYSDFSEIFPQKRETLSFAIKKKYFFIAHTDVHRHAHLHTDS